MGYTALACVFCVALGFGAGRLLAWGRRLVPRVDEARGEVDLERLAGSTPLAELPGGLDDTARIAMTDLPPRDFEVPDSLLSPSPLLTRPLAAADLKWQPVERVERSPEHGEVVADGDALVVETLTVEPDEPGEDGDDPPVGGLATTLIQPRYPWPPTPQASREPTQIPHVMPQDRLAGLKGRVVLAVRRQIAAVLAGLLMLLPPQRDGAVELAVPGGKHRPGRALGTPSQRLRGYITVPAGGVR